MQPPKAIEPVTALKTKSAELIRKARQTGQPIVITQNGKATAVLLDIESYEEMRKTLHMLQFLAKGDREGGKRFTQRQVERRVAILLDDLRGE